MSVDIRSMTKEELAEWLASFKEPKYRGNQIFQWLHREKALSFDEMTNLPLTLRTRLKETAEIRPLAIKERQVSKADGTEKLLLETVDGCLIETVLMRYEYGLSACISSQAGCRMGCTFCASAKGGLVRNLTPSEMLEEVFLFEREKKEPVSHVVIMGTGEPFDNYENLMRFLSLLTHEEGRNLGARHITVSTCGLAPKIRSFADEGLQVNLAVSLHAADQERRKELMPVAKSFPLPELMDACRYYIKKTNRRLTFEYSLVKGKNDSLEASRALISLLKGMNCHVNLIPVNNVTESGYERPGKETIRAFQKSLEDAGIPATVRRELGPDINAACGQLRARRTVTVHTIRET